MKITRSTPEIKSQYVDVCVDVSKSKLDAYCEVAEKAYEVQFSNAVPQIESTLRELDALAKKAGKEGLRVICEPTGGYEEKLLRTARRLGHVTAFVNAEAVSKFRIVESNDSGKSDTKDPRIMNTLAKVGKTLRHRILDDDYVALRREGKAYQRADELVVSAKCRFYRVVKELFCDLSVKASFLYSESGQALVKKFSCDPFQIASLGFSKFKKRMKAAAPRVTDRRLKAIWEEACSSARNQLPTDLIEILRADVKDLSEDVLRFQERKERIGQTLEKRYEALQARDGSLPAATKGVITTRTAARIVAETGPLGDFENARKLMRYAGLNLKQNQSGQFVGHNRLSKKGRPLLRKVLANAVLWLVKTDGLFGEYYAEKKRSMPATKALSAVMRLFLKKFYGWYRSGREFDRDRFFQCESQHLRAA